MPSLPHRGSIMSNRQPFKLYRAATKRSKGYKPVAAEQYVRVSGSAVQEPVNAEGLGDFLKGAGIEIYGEGEKFLLLIPFDRLDSVIERLVDAKDKHDRQA
jgi:hypothetical protein